MMTERDATLPVRDPHIWRAVLVSGVLAWSVFAVIVVMLPGRWYFPALLWWLVRWALGKAHDAWRVRHGKLPMAREVARELALRSRR